MTIALLSASFAANGEQEDGRRYITETITLDDGSGPRRSTYLAEVGENYQAHLDAMGAALVALANRPPPSPDPEHD